MDLKRREDLKDALVEKFKAAWYLGEVVENGTTEFPGNTPRNRKLTAGTSTYFLNNRSFSRWWFQIFLMFTPNLGIS